MLLRKPFIWSRAFYSRAIYAFAAGTYLICLNHGLPNFGESWSPDGDPLHSAIIFKRVYLDGWNTGFHQLGYPDFHRIVVFVVQSPYLLYQFFCGHLSVGVLQRGYPYDQPSYQLVYRDLGIINRLISAIMGLGVIYWVGKTAQYMKDEIARLWAMLTVSVSPAVIYYVHTDTLNVPMLFWLSVAIYYYARALKEASVRDHVILGLLAAISTSTKYYAYGAFVLMTLPLIFSKLKRYMDPPWWLRLLRATFDRRHLYGLFAFAGMFLLTENILWNPKGFVNRIDYALALSEPTTTVSFGRGDALSLGRIKQLTAVLPFVMGWPSAILAGVAVFQSLLKNRGYLYALAWPLFGLYFLTIVPTLDQNMRNDAPFMPLGLLLSILIGCELSWAGDGIKSYKPIARHLLYSGCVLAVLLMLLNAIAMDLLLLKDPRYQAEQYFSQIPPTQNVALFGFRRFFPRLWYTRQCWVINERPAWYSRDVQIDEHFHPVRWLENIQPDYVFVARDYVINEWEQGEPAISSAVTTMRTFFRGLGTGQYGYVLIQEFTPAMGWLFGIPNQRSLIPRLELYQKRRLNSQAPRALSYSTAG